MDDLLREFLTETEREPRSSSTSSSCASSRNRTTRKILGNIFRLVHTIKGTCGFLGLPRLEALAHAAETLMGKFRDGMPVTGDAVTLILATIDRIKEILRRAGETQARAGRRRRRSDRCARSAWLQQRTSCGETEAARRTRNGRKAAALEPAKKRLRPPAADPTVDRSSRPSKLGRRDAGRSKIASQSIRVSSRYARAAHDDGVGAGADPQSAA